MSHPHPLSTESAQATLEAWLARERAVREIIAAGPTPLSREELASLDGMAQMQAVLRGALPFKGISSTLDFLLVELGDGQAAFQGTPGPSHHNPMGGIHGGWYATLLDSALGCAVHTRMPVGRGYTTAELSVKIVKAIGPKVQRVRAIGRVRHCGRQLATSEADLVGPDGTLYAHATTTCLVFDLQR